jgi:exopolysaccharide biosynthesis WecB/TagA/CpsF family protein
MLSFDNLKYYTGTLNEFTGYIFNDVKFSPLQKKIITHINLRNYYYLNKDRLLKEWIRKNCIIVLDGIGLKLGFWLKGFGLVKDLNGTDLFPLFMNEIIKKQLSIFLFGSEENVIKQAEINIRKTYPGIIINGVQNGYYPPEKETDILKQINSSNADILIIGKGFPLQEEFVSKYKNDLNIKLIWNAGGLFDYLSGSKPRAPYFLRKLRLEWLFRFLLEPARMFRRNTVCALGAFHHILTHN